MLCRTELCVVRCCLVDQLCVVLSVVCVYVKFTHNNIVDTTDYIIGPVCRFCVSTLGDRGPVCGWLWYRHTVI